MDVAAFHARFPEFSTADDTLVGSVIAEAEMRLNSAAFGDKYDAAVGYLAAHLLWASPFGTGMRLDGAGKEMKVSRYFTELAQLKAECIPRILVVS